MQKKYDFLVIGSGIAGLSFALKVADYGKVCIICKSDVEETNTRYAQGGIAAVTYEPDSFEKHIEDTLKAGDNLCNKKIVKFVVENAPKQIEDLIQWGIEFDKTAEDYYDLAKEGGHSEYRILHHKDNTGLGIQQVLVKNIRKHKNIDVFENHFAVDIITRHHLGNIVKRTLKNIECHGVYVLNLSNNQTETILAKITVLATGGTGNLYQTTTNPNIATGDGVAMIYRAKGEIENMEFIQFHPTSLYNPGEKPSFLISEAVRGFGAVLRTLDGKEFMQKYDNRKSLASRDIVARAIDNEMKIRGDEHVFLDCTHLNNEQLKCHFPNIYSKCKEIGIDITKNMIPVIPAAHYQCGGIKVNENGLSSIKNLYAIGEVASTGMHGANRLASNSLLEAVVFADSAVKHAKNKVKNIEFKKGIPDWDITGTTYPEEMVLITQNYKEMQQIMSNYVGIVRSDIRLKRALRRLEIIYKETEELYKKSKLSRKLCELRNLINVGYLIIKMAQKRKESIGLHYTINYPSQNKNIKK
ncbi:MAG: L-aspartate oxidase [Bacteroidales bacterium]|nr:L-aspartate oxidase [Bacteroidales bacterium]